MDCLLATSVIFDVTVVVRSDMERIGVCTADCDLWHVELHAILTVEQVLL